jgi:nitrate reductase NapE component
METSQMNAQHHLRGRRRGSELIEFALVSALLFPLLFGTFVVGMNLGRSIQVSQVSRDAGHLYARVVDFSDPANQQVIVRLAQGLGMTAGGGNGVVILSTVTYIGQAQCDAASLSPADCTNLDQNVFVHRIVVGNPSLRASAFGTPDPGLVQSNGDVSNYLTEGSARANGFSGVLTLQPGEIAYVSEAYFSSPDYAMPGYPATGIYARTVF